MCRAPIKFQDPYQLVVGGEMAEHLCPNVIWQEVPARTTGSHLNDKLHAVQPARC